jgi:hypothetical protein
MGRKIESRGGIDRGDLRQSTSPDGFVKASNATPEQPPDEGGERLHGWVFGGVCPRLPFGRCVLAPPPDTIRVARRKEVNPMPD